MYASRFGRAELAQVVGASDIRAADAAWEDKGTAINEKVRLGMCVLFTGNVKRQSSRPSRRVRLRRNYR